MRGQQPVAGAAAGYIHLITLQPRAARAQPLPDEDEGGNTFEHDYAH